MDLGDPYDDGLDAEAFVRTFNERRIVSVEDHPACFEMLLDDGRTLTWWYGGMDASGYMKLTDPPPIESTAVEQEAQLGS